MPLRDSTRISMQALTRTAAIKHTGRHHSLGFSARHMDCCTLHTATAAGAGRSKAVGKGCATGGQQVA
jgi:hypothetical protein